MNKFNSIFEQIMSLFPRLKFELFVNETYTSKNTKRFLFWDQVVSMLFCHLSQVVSLREISGGLATSLEKMIHLGMKKAPSRYTLAYANEHRQWQLYQKLFYHILGLCHAQFGGKHKFRFKNKLMSFDASLILLCLEILDWAKFRRTKEAIKLHLLLDHAGYLPKFVNVTHGKVHEVRIFKKLALEPGTIIAIDRGLVDYALWADWTEKDVYFIYMLKDNADYRIVQKNTVPENKNIIKDQLIRLHGFYSRKKCPHLLRMVTAQVPESKEKLTFIINNLKLAASTIALIYKDPWQIELFFKALKQNLRIKTFIGTSFNAVMIQI